MCSEIAIAKSLPYPPPGTNELITKEILEPHDYLTRRKNGRKVFVEFRVVIFVTLQWILQRRIDFLLCLYEAVPHKPSKAGIVIGGTEINILLLLLLLLLLLPLLLLLLLLLLNILHNLWWKRMFFMSISSYDIILLPEVYSTDLMIDSNTVHGACLVAIMPAVWWPSIKSTDFSICLYKFMNYMYFCLSYTEIMMLHCCV